MSLLLDALKRAALEKKARRDPAEVQPGQAPYSAPADSRYPSIDGDDDRTSLDEATWEELDEADETLEIEIEEFANRIETSSADSDGDEDFAAERGDKADKEDHAALQLAALRARVLAEDEKREHERAALKQKEADEAERLASEPVAALEQELTLESTGQSDDDAVTDAVTEEPGHLAYSEEVDESEESAQVLKESQVEQERVRLLNETTLTTLVHEGHAVNRRQKRRARFLYAMLVLTAIGGIGAYYIYLLRTNNLNLLLGKREPAAPTQTVDSVADSESLPLITVPVDDVAPAAPATPFPESTATTDTGDSAATTLDPGAEVSLTETVVNSVPEDRRPETREQVRDDQPPSANLILKQLAGARPAAPSRQDTGGRIDNASVYASRQAAERVHIYHKAIPTKLGTLVSNAYRAYQAGDLQSAGSLYSEALSLDPSNRDALLGTAAVAAANGQHQTALRLYQQRLTEDPTDSYARAGLLALSNRPDLSAGEIDKLLIHSPQAAHLHFLKGSIHAANATWRDAQAAFFEAHYWDRKNPDYAYNLAVSLDHLGKTEEAASYYRQALMLAQTARPGFSEQAARRRLAELGETDE